MPLPPGAISAVAGPQAAAADDGHGAVVVDVDEAVHGVYAAVQYVKEGAKEGPAAVWTQFQDEARHWHDAPLGTVRDTAMPHGMADFALGLGVGGVLLPLGLIAAKAGFDEMREARQRDKELAARQRQVREVRNELQRERLFRTAEAAAGAIEARDPTLGWLQHQEQSLEDLGFARQQNRRGGQIALGSLWSGGAIAASVAVKAGTQVPLVSIAQGASGAGSLAAAGGAAGAAATAAGVAGTFVLGPLAALGAGYLGWNFHRKTSEKQRNLRQSLAQVRPYLEAVKAQFGDEGMPAAQQRYQHFFEVKSRQREEFYRNFNRLNKVFLAGSAVYASGALGKAALGAAALGSAAVAAHPIGLAAVVALGTVGGVAMGAGSVQFLTGHPKQHRYDGYFTADHARLDRQFLAAVDVLLPPEQQHQGLELRAGLYHALERSESQRQDFLQCVASQLDKHQGRRAWSTDERPAGPRAGVAVPAPSLMRRVGAGVRGAASFGKGLVQHHNLTGAKAAARHTYGEHTDRLTLHRLAEWAQDRASFPEQVAFMHSQLGLLHDSLQAKVELRRGIALPELDGLLEGADLDAIDLNPADLRQGQAALASFIQGQRDGTARDRQLLDEVVALMGRLNGIRRDKAEPPAQDMAALREHFMQLQAGNPGDAQQIHRDCETPQGQVASARRFAKFLKRDAPKQFKNLRGMLLETEMQAARTRELAAGLYTQQRQWQVAPQPVRHPETAIPASR